MIRVYMPLVDSGQQPLGEYTSGKQLIHELITDDFGKPPRSLCIEAQTEDGQSVTVTIPYDDCDTVSVRID